MLLTEEQIKRINIKANADIRFENSWYWLFAKEGKIPLFPWRQNMRLRNMQKEVANGSIYDISVIKCECTEQKCFSVSALAMREFEICEWLLNDTVISVFAQTDNKNVFHVIGRMKSGVRCSIDITNGLNIGTRETNRHEIISSVGELCDLPVGMQYASEDTYVFRGDCAVPQFYTEVIIENELYTREEAQLIRDALTLVCDEGARAERIKRFAYLENVVKWAEKSSAKSSLTEVCHEEC